MAVNERNWLKREYESWDEAFRGLSPVVRQQSVRVAAYTQALFVQACASSFGADTRAGAERMDRQYADVAYKCGMYHQLGKALVPTEYQLWQPAFTEEEKSIYRRYTTDGRLLVAALQDRGNVRGKQRLDQEIPTKSIPALMIRESCEQHMERWNGSGYPAGRKGSEISPIAQIVGLAKELDRLASETKSETPFDDACQTLYSQAGTLWSAGLIEILKAAREKCYEVFDKYLHYTRALPVTIPLVQKRPERPMGLKYQPMVAGVDNQVVAYEAIPWFGGVEDKPDEFESIDQLEPLFQRTKMVTDISFYLLYEASDAVLRMNNCRLDMQGILLQMMPAFYKQESQLERLMQLFEEQTIPKRQLLLTVPVRTLQDAAPMTLEVIRHYNHNGIRLVLDGYDPAVVSDQQLADLEFTYVRFASELYLQQQTVQAMRQLNERGVSVIGGGADSQDVLAWLAVRGVSFSSGSLTGEPVDEERMIRDCLMREK